jgi:zinc protease
MQAVGRFKTTVIVLLITLVGLSPAGAVEAHRHRLPNGVTVITKPASWNRIVAISVNVEAGSKHDPPQFAGLARLTNELLIEGTSRRSAMELADFLDGHGIDLRTYTTQDFAGVHLICIDEHFDAALEILGEILTEPVFAEGRLLRLQERTLGEIERGKADARRRNYAQLYDLVFDGHPYARPVEGTAETIGRMTRDRIAKFYSTNYVAGSTAIAIVGNFSEETAIESLSELLSGYARGRSEKLDVHALRRDESTTGEIYMDVPGARAAIGYLAAPAPHKDYPAVRVLASLLGGGSSARIPLALEERGADIAIDSGAFCFSAVQEAAIVISMETSDVDESLDIVDREVERLRREPVSDDELLVARNRVAGEVTIKGQTNLMRALRLSMDYLATGHVDVMDTFLEQVARVSKDDILRVAHEYLVAPAVAIVRPGRAAGRGDVGGKQGI